MEKSEKSLSVVLINCDWRDIFSTSFLEFKDKLDRDRLGLDTNSFFVFSWARTSYFKKNGVNVSSLHVKTRLDLFRPILDFVTLFRVPFAIRTYDIKPDVIVVYDFGFLPTAWIIKVLRGGKVVMCLNNQPRVYSKTRSFGEVKALYSLIIEKLFWHFADHFFTINETMKKYIESLGAPSQSISIFSMDTIKRDQEFIKKSKQGIVRARLGIPPGSKMLLTVARLEAEKNYPKLLSYFAQLGNEYVLVSLGRGSLLPELKLQAKKLGIDSRVFFEGFVDRSDIWNYYQDADAFVLLSKAEALGVVFWEAMYAGVPVIGSDVEGIVETVGHDLERGRILKSTDSADDFKQKVSFCTIGSKELEDMCTRARSFVETQIRNTITINDIPLFKK